MCKAQFPVSRRLPLHADVDGRPAVMETGPYRPALRFLFMTKTDQRLCCHFEGLRVALISFNLEDQF